MGHSQTNENNGCAQVKSSLVSLSSFHFPSITRWDSITFIMNICLVLAALTCIGRPGLRADRNILFSSREAVSATGSKQNPNKSPQDAPPHPTTHTHTPQSSWPWKSTALSLVRSSTSNRSIEVLGQQRCQAFYNPGACRGDQEGLM